jgi:nitrate reductase gamma subunit
METLAHFLDAYAPFAIAVALLGVLYKSGMHVGRMFTRGRRPGRAPNAIDNPARLSWLAALRKVFVFPTERFSMRANPVFAMGAVLYHVGIVSIAAGYGLSLVLLAVKLAAGDPIPSVMTGAEASHDLSASNLFAIVFGNAEPLQARFLFGWGAETFREVTWVAVASALVGNTMLLLTHLRGRGGAIVKDLDPAAKGLRVRGKYAPSHLFVTALVYAIIWTEILARLQVAPGVVYLHATLGATMILVLPYTYLFHIIYGPIGVLYAARRWRERTIA